MERNMIKAKTEYAQAFFRIRYLYIVLFVIFTVLNKFVPFQFIPHSVSAVIYSSFAAAGAVLLILDFFAGRIMFTIKYNGVMVLFFIAFAISAAVNIRYGVTDNIKTFVWMCIQVFLLCAADHRVDMKTHLKQFRVIADIFIAMWFAGVVVSVGQYIIQYCDAVPIPDDEDCIVGFAMGRLFGIFTDPNVAAVCSLLAIVFALYIIVKCLKKGSKLKFYYIITIVFESIYVVLSGSRTALLISAAAIFVSALLFVKEKLRKHDWKKILKLLAAGAISAVCAVVAVLGMSFTKTTLSYVPKLLNPLVLQIEKSLDISIDNSMVIEDQIDMTRPDVAENSDISNARFKIWRDSLKLFEKSPIVGTSPRNHLAFAEDKFEDMYIVYRQYSVHNGYLSVLIYTGILGAATILVWLVLIVKTVASYLLRKNTSDEYYVPIAFFSVALLIIGISAFPMMGIFFGNSVIELLFWLILGYTLCFIRKSEPEKYTREPLLYRITQRLKDRLTHADTEIKAND